MLSEKILAKCDYNSLYDFLQYCQKIAKKKGQMQIASIGLEIQYVDPLVALQSIYGLKDLCFYFEYPKDDYAVAGVEAVLERTFNGVERFKKVRDFSNEVLANTIIFEDLEGSLVGPCFFTSFTFYDVAEQDNDGGDMFPAARIFLPAWQMVRKGFRCFLTANVAVDTETNIEFLTQKIGSTSLNFNLCENKNVSLVESQNSEMKLIEVGGLGWYEKAVEEAIECIEAGEFEKIVIARAVDIECEKVFDSFSTLNRLRQIYPLCRSCFVTNGEQRSFICATPERLLKVENNRIFTEALAGSIARGSSEMEDEAFGKTLLESSKDLHEHQFVVDSIVERLSLLGIKSEFENRPQLKKLANIQHLYTPIEADLPKDVHFLDVVSILHPTPAVCGTPLVASGKAIKKIENFDRGLYAGVIGFFDYQGNGEFVVGIRSALIDGCKARLYAGGGIVKGSNADSERKETDIKLQAMLKNLR